jgi:RNA polymerase sigma factor (sigma-70 family)
LACLVDAQHAPLLRFCRRLVGGGEPAQDLAQETLLRAVQVIGRLQEPSRFPAWLLGIAVNLAHKWRRRQARWPISLDHLAASRPGEPLDDLLPAAKATEQVVEDALQAGRILDAIAALPSPLRQVVVRYYLEEQSYGEISAALELPISTIKWRLYSSRLRLRQSLDLAGGPPGTSRSTLSQPPHLRQRRSRPPAVAGKTHRKGNVDMPSPTTPTDQSQPQPQPPPSLAEQLERAVTEQHQRLAAWHGTMAQHPSLTEAARNAFRAAEAEARRLGHGYLGTEHILVGLLSDEHDPAARVLSGLGVTAAKVREVVDYRIGRGDRDPSHPLVLVPKARNTVHQAIEDARRLGHDYLGTEHLLLGLVREGTGIGALIIESCGVDLDELRRRVIQAVGNEQAEGDA